MANVNKVTSYRSELEGIFQALNNEEFLNWAPEELDQWCDNKQVVHDSMNYSYRSTDMMGADKDLILAIHHLKSTLTTTINCRHVYGHHDRGSGKTSTKEQERSLPAQVELRDSTGRGAAPPPTSP